MTRAHALAVRPVERGPAATTVLARAGRPLDAAARADLEPRLGHRFGDVRVHADGAAADSAQAAGALAYTVGRDIVFGAGRYRPQTPAGRRLLAHELAHVVQQRGGVFGDSAGAAEREANAVAAAVADEGPVPAIAARTAGTLQRATAPNEPQVPVSPSRTRTAATPPKPETCPPPPQLACATPASPPPTRTATIVFPHDSAALDATQRATIDATAAAWHTASGSPVVRIDGFASAEGPCAYNWSLSCRRAIAVATELMAPSDRSPGVPAASVEVVADGESDAFGPAAADNRVATISLPVPPPPPPPPAPPSCVLPSFVGTGGAWASGTDFTHFDFPSISFRSESVLFAWASAHRGRPAGRGAVTDLECELEMDAVLMATSGGAGHSAFTRFAAGTGGTEVLGNTSTLGALALTAPSFLATVANVQRTIEGRLAGQASGGALDPCAVRFAPPATHFPLGGSDPLPLQGVIGGTQGRELFIDTFTGNIALRTYSMELRFVIYDDFGVDEADLYFPGLIGFWVLQHERSPSRYAPFVNQLDLTVTVSGTF